MHRNITMGPVKPEPVPDRKEQGVSKDQNNERRRDENESDRKFGGGPSPQQNQRGDQGQRGRGGGQGNRGRGGSGFRREFRSFQQQQQQQQPHSQLNQSGDGASDSGSHPDTEDPSASEPRPEKKFTGRCRLFVGNLPNDMTDDEFRKLFEPFGESTEHFLNAARGFGFVRMDTRHNAEKARIALDCQQKRGRYLRVRFAAHSAALRVKYLSQHISNEILEQTFSMFGEVERAIVVVDDRGRPTGEGIVEFSRKPAAMSALKRITDGVFIMSSNPRPVLVEPLDQNDETDGLPEIFFQKTSELMKDREQPPRFASPGSFEFEFGQKWKALYKMHKEQEELLRRNFDEEVRKLEMDQETALLEQQAVMMRQDLLRRQEELRLLEEQTQMEIQRRVEMRRQDEERRRQEMELRRRQEEMIRRQKEEGLKPGDMFGIDRHERQQGGMRQERGGNAPPLQPPPVPPGMERPQRPQMGGPMNQMGAPPGMMPGNIGGMGNPVMGPPSTSGGMNPNQQQSGEKIGVQMRGGPARFEHPPPGMGGQGGGNMGPGNNMGPGANMGPGGKMGPDGGQMREDFFEAKRQRRF